jgi:hypothetical protein
VDGLGDLPFPFADKLLIALGGPAMIDHAAAIAQLNGAILPEIISHSRAPAPVFAQQNRSRQMLRL